MVSAVRSPLKEHTETCVPGLILKVYGVSITRLESVTAKLIVLSALRDQDLEHAAQLLGIMTPSASIICAIVFTFVSYLFLFTPLLINIFV